MSLALVFHGLKPLCIIKGKGSRKELISRCFIECLKRNLRTENLRLRECCAIWPLLLFGLKSALLTQGMLQALLDYVPVVVLVMKHHYTGFGPVHATQKCLIGSSLRLIVIVSVLTVKSTSPVFGLGD